MCKFKCMIKEGYEGATTLTRLRLAAAGLRRGRRDSKPCYLLRDSARFSPNLSRISALLRCVENHHFAESRRITQFSCPNLSEKSLTSAAVLFRAADPSGVGLGPLDTPQGTQNRSRPIVPDITYSAGFPGAGPLERPIRPAKDYLGRTISKVTGK